MAVPVGLSVVFSFSHLTFYPLVTLRNVGGNNIHREFGAEIYHDMKGKPISGPAKDQTPMTFRVVFDNLSIENRLNHVTNRKAILEPFRDRVIND